MNNTFVLYNIFFHRAVTVILLVKGIFCVILKIGKLLVISVFVENLVKSALKMKIRISSKNSINSKVKMGCKARVIIFFISHKSRFENKHVPVIFYFCEKFEIKH